MKCPSCGDTGLEPNQKFCLECGFCLAHDQNIPSMESKIVVAVSSEKPKGESLQQNGTATKKDQNKLPFDQQLGPMQAPDDDLSASPVQQGEAAAEKSPRPSSESAPCPDGTPATTDPDNKDFGKAEEIATSFVEGGSAADTNTPDRAKTGERQGEDIAWEQKVENKGEGQEDEGSTSQHQFSILAAGAVESLNDTCTSMKSTTEKIGLSRPLAVPMSTPGQQSNTFTRNEDPSSSNREIEVIMAAVMDTGLASSPSMSCEPDWMGLKFNLFAFDFDGTCTQKDTTSLLYKASEKYRSSTQAEMKTIDERWIEIGTIYWQGHQETVSKSMALHTDPNSLPHFNEKGLRSFLQEVSKYDMAMIKKVEASEILKGISKEGIKEIAKEVKFSPGCLNVLNHINLPLHLISVNWCQELIQVNLDHLRHLNIFANSFPLEGELSSGHVGKKVTSPFDKETIFQDLVHKLSTNSSNGISVFVGDSIGDILAMLKADVGIVVGKSHTLRKVAKAFGIKLLPLQEIQKMARNECQEFATPKERGVLFEAPSWNEIGFTLFGTRYIPNKF